MTLEGDKLGSAKDQSWDISRIISPISRHPKRMVRGLGTVVRMHSFQFWLFHFWLQDCNTHPSNWLLDPTFWIQLIIWTHKTTVGHAGASLLRRMEDTDQQDSTKRPSSSKAVFTPIQQLAGKEKRSISGRWRSCHGVSKEQHFPTLEFISNSWGISFQGPHKRHPETLPSGKPKVWCPFQVFIVYIQLLSVPDAIYHHLGVIFIIGNVA